MDVVDAFNGIPRTWEMFVFFFEQSNIVSFLICVDLCTLIQYFVFIKQQNFVFPFVLKHF